jgi:hypothetical protein
MKNQKTDHPVTTAARTATGGTIHAKLLTLCFRSWAVAGIKSSFLSTMASGLLIARAALRVHLPGAGLGFAARLAKSPRSLPFLL